MLLTDDIWDLRFDSMQYLKTHTLLMSVPAVRSRTSSVTSRFGGISECCRGTFEVV